MNILIYTTYNNVRLVLGKHNSFFQTTIDCTGKPSISPTIKVLVALESIAFGVSSTTFLDYFQISMSIARQSLIEFAHTLVTCNDPGISPYIRKFSRSDILKVTDLHQCEHGVPGMVGSLDCMHVRWANCPTAHKGQYVGAKKKPTLIMEAVADYNMWLWHINFGHAGSNNDINVCDKSSLRCSLFSGEWTNSKMDFDYYINGSTFKKLFFLVDGIYPSNARFVQPFVNPVSDATIE